MAKLSTTAFINKYQEAAEKLANKLGANVDYKWILAQWALESGYGSSKWAVDFNNLGGVNVPSSTTPPKYYNGSDKSGINAFSNLNEFVDYTADYIFGANKKSSTYYKSGLNTAKNVNEYATALKKGGYATDTNYVSKIENTYNTMFGDTSVNFSNDTSSITKETSNNTILSPTDFYNWANQFQPSNKNYSVDDEEKNEKNEKKSLFDRIWQKIKLSLIMIGLVGFLFMIIYTTIKKR